MFRAPLYSRNAFSATIGSLLRRGQCWRMCRGRPRWPVTQNSKNDFGSTLLNDKNSLQQGAGGELVLVREILSPRATPNCY